MGEKIIFDPALFRQMFPTFANATTYPDAMLQMYFDMATCYTSDFSWRHVLAGTEDCRRLSIYLMTAHLVAIATMIPSGQQPGFTTSATVDKVSVTTAAPPLRNQWQWWLMTTPYGQQYWALLQVKSVGGFYVGGAPERSAIRIVGGRFPGNYIEG